MDEVRAVSRLRGAIGGKVLLALVTVLGTGLASTADAEPSIWKAIGSYPSQRAGAGKGSTS